MNMNMSRKNSIFDNTQHLTVIAWVLVAVFLYGILVGYSGRGLMGISTEHQTNLGFGRFGDVAKSLETGH